MNVLRALAQIVVLAIAVGLLFGLLAIVIRNVIGIRVPPEVIVGLAVGIIGVLAGGIANKMKNDRKQ